ncbi:MAG: GNAT family N-acetyltransferase [Labilithrix sp.]|nr:GNAT family N-acetyltransferase [Labilithrix sp.]
MAIDGAPVRPLRRDEHAAAVKTLAASFDDDPLFRSLLPDDARRAAWLSWFHRCTLNECASVGGVYTLASGPESGAVALLPPGSWPRPILQTLAALRIPRAFPTFDFVRRGLHIERRIRALHPRQEHVYVAVLGVHPSLQGRGLGATLMRHACALASEGDCVVHLETSNPVNLPFYRRFGLEVGVEIVSHGGPPVWTLTTSHR